MFCPLVFAKQYEWMNDPFFNAYVSIVYLFVYTVKFCCTAVKTACIISKL